MFPIAVGLFSVSVTNMLDIMDNYHARGSCEIIYRSMLVWLTLDRFIVFSFNWKSDRETVIAHTVTKPQTNIPALKLRDGLKRRMMDY